jgi:hypothetical protein
MEKEARRERTNDHEEETRETAISIRRSSTSVEAAPYGRDEDGPLHLARGDSGEDTDRDLLLSYERS